jgi:hypothetical protein
MRQFLMFAILATAFLSGCVGSDTDPESTTSIGGDDETVRMSPDVSTVQATLATAAELGEPVLFAEKVVDAAVQFASDLYEPTLDMSNTGVLYIAGHTIGADTTGAPAYYSQDDGETWTQLPTVGSQSIPTVHTSSPPPSDEIFIIAGDDGWAFGVDITLATFPMTFWGNNGTTFEYHNPNGYDRVESSSDPCSAASLNDRPWAAYANGTLFVVNNPGGGPAQLGVMEVPPALPLGASIANGPTWNTCASPGGYIPGIPDISDNGVFVLPQISGGNLQTTIGHKSDVMAVETTIAMNFTNGGTITSNYGQAVFDDSGDLFVGIANNTFDEETGNWTGAFKLATSTDDGVTFMDRTFLTDGRVTSFYMDGNLRGEGALLTWAVPGLNGTDWYMAHAFIAADGSPVVENVAIAIEGGPAPSAHVTGAAAGPDGRAYFAMYEGGEIGGTPLSVWAQQTGPTLPGKMVVAVEAIAQA